MSWLSQFLGVDAANEQQDAIGKQQQQAGQQSQWMQGQYSNILGNMQGGIEQYTQKSNQAANDLVSQGQNLMNWSNTAAKEEYQGALKDIYTQGRNQAASSGLIGGFQEGQNTAPAIAALGRSFATQQTDIQRQNLMTMLGINQNAAQMKLSPYAMSSQMYGNLAQSALGGANQAGANYTGSLGNYSQGANPLGNLFGAIGGLAGGIGSLFGAFNTKSKGGLNG
jgi:hypothetical protein